jgi:PAS domain S-box-containing protein
MAHLTSTILSREEMPFILTPLKRRGKISGILVMSATDLAEPLILSVRNLAQHISVALELATEYADRRRVEEALRKSEARYRAVFEHASDALFLENAQEEIVDVNRRACQLTGYTREELLSMRTSDLEVEVIRKQPPHEVYAAPASMQDTVFESALAHRDGTRVPVEVTVTPLRDGDTVLFLSVVRDIAERKRVERLLEALNQAALAMEHALTPDEIFAAVAKQLGGLGFSCAVFPTDESQSRLFPRYLSHEVGALRAAEKLVGFRHEDFSIPIAAIDVYREVIWERKSVFAEGAAEAILCQLLPRPVRGFAGEVVRMLKIPKSIIAPLAIGDEVIGLLSVQSKDLTEDDVPAITAFAHQAAAAWRRALLFEEAQREIAERMRAEEALRESENRFRDLFEGIPACCWVLDREGRILHWNHACEELYGWTAGQAVGKTMYELMVKDENVAATQETIAAVFQGQSFRGLEYEDRRADGTTCHVLVNEYPLKDAEGRVVMGICAEVDITERKRAEDVLRDAEWEKQVILDSQLEHVIYQDREHRILWPNQAACESVGMTRENLMGRHCYEIWARSSQPCDDCPVALAMATQRPQEIEKTTPDGRIWFIRGYPVMNADGEVTGGIEVTQEITDRKRSEAERERLLEQIQEQARQVQQIVDTVPEGMLLVDAEGEVLLTNPVAEDALAVLAGAEVGSTLTQLGNRPLVELLARPPEGLWHEVATDGRNFEVVARPLETGPSSGGWVLVIRDVTQERQVQQRANQQERLAAVGQLAAGIAHDFNNVMATIVLYAQVVLRTEALSSQNRERLATIDQQAKHATRLIQQILDFSRRSMLERQPLDLLPLLKEQVKLLERTLPESISIGLVYGRDEYMINADPTRIQQAIMNLALNARDAMTSASSDFGELRLRRAQTSASSVEPSGRRDAGGREAAYRIGADTSCRS